MLSKRKLNLDDSQEVRDLKKKRNINFSVINAELFMKEKSVLHMEKYVINAIYLIISLRCANQK